MFYHILPFLTCFILSSAINDNDSNSSQSVNIKLGPLPQIVTSCGVLPSADEATVNVFFDMLANFVGSVHVHAPGRTIVIYNLGFPDQLAIRIRNLWKGVILKPFPFEDFPPHVRDLSNFAWKPIAMHLALKEYPSILYLDSGAELVGPIDEVDADIQEKGHWFVAQEGLHTHLKCCGKVLELTHPETLSELQTDAKTIGDDAIMCAGGLQGYTRESRAFKEVLKKAYGCALRLACIAPIGSNLDNHRQDQSVFSVLVNIHGFGDDIHRDSKYWGTQNNGSRGRNDAVIYLRKKYYPKPYGDSILRRRSMYVFKVSYFCL